MLRNIAAWAIAFTVSMMLSFVPVINVSQGQAFLVLYLIACLGVLIFTLVTSLVTSSINGSMQYAGILAMWNAGVVLLVTLAALAVSWLAAWFFMLDFFVVYQLVTLGQCLMWTIKLPASISNASAHSKADSDSDAGADAGVHTESNAVADAASMADTPAGNDGRSARSTHYASSGKYTPK